MKTERQISHLVIKSVQSYIIITIYFRSTVISPLICPASEEYTLSCFDTLNINDKKERGGKIAFYIGGISVCFISLPKKCLSYFIFTFFLFKIRKPLFIGCIP